MISSMKIAVYTIAKNEEQFVEKWAQSCADADYRVILDTGSTDNTHELAMSIGVSAHQQVFNPWRFDNARNAALALVPDDADICIALDMDEVLVDGWREALEREKILPHITRPRYKYVWSWNDDGTEGLVYGGDKIHRRHGYKWKHPVHEVIIPDGIEEVQYWIDGLEIHHHPDSAKSRSQYLPLLELAVQEDPNDDRNQFYLAREYFFKGQYDKAQVHFAEHYRLSVWAPERAANRRYMAKMLKDKEEYYLYQAVAEAPLRREAWVDLALMYYFRNEWVACRAAAQMALRIKEKPLEYLCEASAWGYMPHDLLAVAAWNLGDKETAREHGAIALEMNPKDQRLQNNYSWYLKD